MPAKTESDKAKDALIKILQNRGANPTLVASGVLNAPEHVVLAATDQILAFIQLAKIYRDHPPADMTLNAHDAILILAALDRR